MIRSIKQRIYVTGILPLAVLAVALVGLNGAIRIGDAQQELQNARNITAELLHGPAVDALVVGNTLGFQSIAEKAIEASRSLLCISLRDMTHRVLVTVGTCTDISSSAAIAVRGRRDDLSDFVDPDLTERAIGELRIEIDDDAVVRRRNAVVAQLALSFLLIGAVIAIIGKLLRSRLITPIKQIDGAMHALSLRDYSARISVAGDDELARLATAVSATILTVASYTRELEQGRQTADEALNDADEANLARDALLRTLTQDLEEPMGSMHARLTEIAIANKDSDLRARIKEVIGVLQDAEANLADLVEIASQAQPRRRPPFTDLGDVAADIERSVQQLAESARRPIHLKLGQPSKDQTGKTQLAGILVSVDVARLRKALLYLIRAMSRRCNGAGVFINAEFITFNPHLLHVSLHLKAFYEPMPQADLGRPTNFTNKPPAFLGWTEREVRVLEYLLREIGLDPTYSAAPGGTLNILLEAKVRYSRIGGAPHSLAWPPSTEGQSTAIVTDDPTMMRIASRGELANDDITLLSFADALENSALLNRASALVIDLTGEVATAFTLLDGVRSSTSQAIRIAVCPPGNISDALGERLFEFGFSAVLQKPLHYTRLLEVIRVSINSAGASWRANDCETPPGT
jgi:hypothetical protein